MGQRGGKLGGVNERKNRQIIANAVGGATKDDGSSMGFSEPREYNTETREAVVNEEEIPVSKEVLQMQQ